jgi:oligoribonuclease
MNTQSPFSPTQKIKRFVWIDLEMTGLDSSKDVILEIATIITNPMLEIISYGPHCVIAQPPEVITAMIPEVTRLHTISGLIDRVADSTTSLAQAYTQTFDFITAHCTKNEAVLCGNSVWMDRQFLARYMPDIVQYLNYRLVDVSSLKILINKWYPSDPHLDFKKKNVHRALDDIKESIAELQHYRRYFFI